MGRADLSELGEDRFFEVDDLGDGFDDHVHVLLDRPSWCWIGDGSGRRLHRLG